ncbi:MAG: hypothetical protein ACXWYS_07710 [Gaiellaceae bacterium]
MADDPVAQLYGLPLNDFVPGRDALARELRRAGDKERAAEVARLKRPSVAAWAVNQLARRNRKELDLLLDAGHRLRTGQEEALQGGDPGKFQTARSEHDRAVRALVGAARELLGSERGTASDQMLSSIERTLRYASIDEEQRAALASGRLTEEVDAPGFGAFAGMAIPPAPPHRPAPQAERAQPAAKRARPDGAAEREARKSRLAEAQAALKVARERERETRQTLREAQRAERTAAQQHERATDELAAAREAADAAATDVQEAADRVEAERAG